MAAGEDPGSTRTVNWLVIPPDGLVEGTQEIECGPNGGLVSAAQIIGGDAHVIEPIFLGKYGHAYCDQEGKQKGLPLNERATHLARFLGWSSGDFLVGTVVFCGKWDSHANECDVPQGVVDAFNGLSVFMGWR